MERQTMKLIYIKFYDHSADSNSTWKEMSELHIEPVTIEVVGFRVKEDELSYHLVQAHGQDDFSNSFSVLKSTIILQKEFKIPKRKSSKPRRKTIRG